MAGFPSEYEMALPCVTTKVDLVGWFDDGLANWQWATPSSGCQRHALFCKPPGLSPTSDAPLIGCTSSTSGSGLRSLWSGRPLQAMRKENWDSGESVFSWIRPFQSVAIVRSPDNWSALPPRHLSRLSFFSLLFLGQPRLSLAFCIPDIRYHHRYPFSLPVSGSTALRRAGLAFRSG